MTHGSSRERAIAQEQEFVDTAYAGLDSLKDAYTDRLRNVRNQTGQESPGELSERDSFATHYEDNLVRLRNVENRLVLGRLDLSDGTHEHIGRIGLKDANRDIILLDWRAPGAGPFYQATAVNPGDVVRRRHIQTRFRSVTGIEDELLDSSTASTDLVLTGEGALMAAMNEARDGKMSDIVATIQGEQDRIIRSKPSGVLVVQGGPGTGKTAVALHRAAYLLYANRERLSRSGVLVVGPSSTFLSYIDAVLPSLGETDVVSTTISGLMPGVRATVTEPSAVAEIKGRLVWRTFARRAVRDILERPLLSSVSLSISGVEVSLSPDDVEFAQVRARRKGSSHNESRDIYAKYLVDKLASRVAAAKAIELSENSWIVGDVAASIDARREINLHWLPSAPSQLLERIYSRPHLLERIAPELSPSERQLLFREKGSGFSVADIAILDELAENLGPFLDGFEQNQQAASAARQAKLSQYVRETMSAMNLGGGIVDSEMMTDRMGESSSGTSIAERAFADRTWTYGHVVVDEAQELSPMQWEMLIRRCPSRSFTVVGDLDQRREGSPSGGWPELLGRLAENTRLEQLTISYRTPATILDAANRTLERAGVNVAPIRAARDIPNSLEVMPFQPGEQASAARAAINRATRDLDAHFGENSGTIGVIFPAALSDSIAACAPENIDSRVRFVTATEAKGLEYDDVVLIEPTRILAEGPGSLYVAMTRATQRMYVVHSEPLPDGLY